MSASTADIPQQLGAVLDAVECGAVVVGPRGRIVHANRRFCELVSYSLEDLRRRSFAQLCSPLALLDTQPPVPDAEGASATLVAIRRADGQPLPVRVSDRALHSSAAPPGHRLITVIDISEQKQAEELFLLQYEEIARLSDTVLEQALDLKEHNKSLEERIQERTAELREANLDSILMLAVASEARDTDTGNHVLRIKEYARTLAREIGLPAERVEEISFSAVLHDVGKIHVPDYILKKPGPLTPDERRVMEHHTVAGERILSTRTFFQAARSIARSHHENWDGSGYPDGLAGEAIDLAARIVHIVDVYDALTTQRVYKPAWPVEKAVAEIERCAGTMFDPRLTALFITLLAQGIFDVMDAFSATGASGVFVPNSMS